MSIVGSSEETRITRGVYTLENHLEGATFKVAALQIIFHIENNLSVRWQSC